MPCLCGRCYLPWYFLGLFDQLICVCSDKILTFGIRSIRSPAKVGLVVTELLITSPVVSWRRWQTTPPPPRTAAQLPFFAQPLLSEDPSLRDVLPFVCIFVYVLVDGLVSLQLFELEYFFALFTFI